MNLKMPSGPTGRFSHLRSVQCTLTVRGGMLFRLLNSLTCVWHIACIYICAHCLPYSVIIIIIILCTYTEFNLHYSETLHLVKQTLHLIKQTLRLFVTNTAPHYTHPFNRVHKKMASAVVTLDPQIRGGDAADSSWSVGERFPDYCALPWVNMQIAYTVPRKK